MESHLRMRKITGKVFRKSKTKTEMEILLKLKQQMELKLEKHNHNIYKNTMYNVTTLWIIKHMLYSKKRNHLISTFHNTVFNNLTITCTSEQSILQVIYNITTTGNRKGIINN